MSRVHVHPDQYQQQLLEKRALLQELFSDLDVPELEVFDSPPVHYRMRAEFRVWHDDDDLYYIMFDRETKEKYRVDTFGPASQLINDCMPALIAAIQPNPILRRKLFQVDFLSTLSGELLVSMLYHRKIDDEWVAHATELKTQLRSMGFPVDLIGRARKIKYTLHRDFVVEQLTAHNRTYTYQQYENSFTQPNARVAEKMLSWAIDCTRDSTGDLLELYCGNGHFSLAMAQNFNQVLATELAKSSVKAAQYNIKVNEIDNVRIVRLSAEEVVEALNGTREFKRLKQAGIVLNDYQFSTVFVDPPRSGLDDDGCALAQQFDRIVYISCNPNTLKANLETLTTTHRITRFALFDQFPYTHHTEAGVLLERR